MSISRRGLLALGLAAASALLLPGGMAVALFVIVWVVVLTDAWMVKQVPEVSISVAPILSRGIESPLQVTVNPSTGVTVRVVGSPDVRIHPDTGSGGLEARVIAVRRGEHDLAAPATLAEGPLGLGRWYHRAGRPTTVVVYPDMVAARHIASEVRLGRFGDPSRRSRGPLGLGTELEAIREYLPDDDIRQVNWPATARTGTPMSNTYRVEQERELIVLLDMGRLMAAPVGDGTERTRLDAAVDAAAAVAAVADVVGDRIGVVAFDDHIRRRMSPRRDGGGAVATAIHDVEPSAADSDFGLAFRTVSHNKRAFLLVLTDLLEETAARPLLEAAPILARHHAVTIAGIRDPSVVTALTDPPDTVEESHRAAVALDIESSRRRAAATLEGYGTTVIDAPAAQLSTRCVASYLRAKRRARL